MDLAYVIQRLENRICPVLSTLVNENWRVRVVQKIYSFSLKYGSTFDFAILRAQPEYLLSILTIFILQRYVVIYKLLKESSVWFHIPLGLHRDDGLL